MNNVDAKILNMYPFEVEISHKAYWGKYEFYNRYGSITEVSWAKDGKHVDIAKHNHGLRKEINQWIEDNTDGGIECTGIILWRFKTEKDATKFIKAGFGSYRVALREMTDEERQELIKWYTGTSMESLWRGTHYFRPNREIKHTSNEIKFDRQDEALFCKMRWG